MNKIISIASLALLTLSLAACTEHRRVIVTDAPGTPSSTRVLKNVDDRGIAVEGYDVVAYFTDAKPVLGDPRHQTAYRGAIYQFASAQHKALFDANPANYEPQFGGFCGYAASIDHISPVDPNFWEIIDGRLVLQHNQKAWDLWHKDVPGNLVKADANWPGLVAANGE